MLGAIAQFETEIRAERQMDGIQKAKKQGIKFGRSKKLSKEEIVELQAKREKGVMIKILMEKYSVSKSSVYWYLKENASDKD